MALLTEPAPVRTEPPFAQPVLRHPVSTPGWWRDAVGIATWLSMLVVVALWVSGGGAQDLTGWASAIR